MFNLHDSFQEAQQRYDNLIAERAQDRLAARARGNTPSFGQRVARVTGGALVQLGIRLLRMGQVELAHTVELLNPPVRQSRVN